MKMKHHTGNNLSHDLASLSAMDRTELAECWNRIYATPLPRNISQKLMLKALAYRIQEQAMGGLEPQLRAQLMSVSESGLTTCTSANTTVAFDGVFYSVISLRKPGVFVAIVTMRGYNEL